MAYLDVDDAVLRDRAREWLERYGCEPNIDSPRIVANPGWPYDRVGQPSHGLPHVLGKWVGAVARRLADLWDLLTYEIRDLKRR
jgi:hypothetical protein